MFAESRTPGPITVRLTRMLIAAAVFLCDVSAIMAQERPGSGPAALAMPDEFSAATAEAVLARGGNAVDAAVAAAFTLAVTYPEAGNIGGGGLATLWIDGQAAFLDFRETAPQASTADMYLDDSGAFLQRDALVGVRAAGVPGTVQGLWDMHQRFGTLPWTELLQPAIRYARGGFTVHADLAEYRAETSDFLAGATNFDAHFAGLRTGATFVQLDLAKTLERIADNHRDFYTGETARLLVAQMRRDGGLIDAADLRNYRSRWREPLRRGWRHLELIAPPPPSSGGVALLQLLALRDARDDLFAGVPHNSGRYVHLLAELEKRVFADRAQYLGDPDFVDVPVAQLLDPAYLARRAAGVSGTSISVGEAVEPGLESADTTHFSIVDHAGNAVALTYTLNWDFGSGVVVEGAGFVLNNEMDDFSAKPGAANKFGVVGGEANAIAPGKRMLSSMTPTIALEDGQVELVIGTRGGSTIFTSVFQTLLNLYDFDMSARDAVGALRFHHQLPGETLLRHDPWPVPPATAQTLRALGYELQENSWGTIGDVQLIIRRGDDLQGAADPRARGVTRILAPPEPVFRTREARPESE